LLEAYITDCQESRASKGPKRFLVSEEEEVLGQRGGLGGEGKNIQDEKNPPKGIIKRDDGGRGMLGRARLGEIPDVERISDGLEREGAVWKHFFSVQGSVRRTVANSGRR